MPIEIAPLPLLLVAVAGYLVGSIPTGYLICRSQGVDPRARGSGKTGATNVLRTLGRKASAAVLVSDMAKGAVAVLIARWLFSDVLAADVVAGVAAIVGHVFPVFIGFRGGRGVATALGAMLAISPIVGLVGLAAGALIIARSRIASLGSLVGAALALLFIAALFFTRLQPLLPVIYCLLAAMILVFTHRDNIQRLLAGTERKIQL